MDKMRSMMASLSLSIDNVSQIDKKISQVDQKEPEKKFMYNMRSMMTSLSQSIHKVSEIDKKKYHIQIKKNQKTNLWITLDL